MKLYLPHINYTVFVRRITELPSGLEDARAYAKRINDGMAAIYLPNPKKPKLMNVVHECTHILQYICESRHIDFVAEMEHCSYIMGFLVGNIMGYEYMPYKEK